MWEDDEHGVGRRQGSREEGFVVELVVVVIPGLGREGRGDFRSRRGIQEEQLVQSFVTNATARVDEMALRVTAETAVVVVDVVVEVGFALVVETTLCRVVDAVLLRP